MSKKYVVAEGFAFTSGGIILNEGDEITAENFGGNEDIFKAAQGYGYSKDFLRRIIGDGEKKLAAAEKDNYGKTNRSLHYIKDLQKGVVLTNSDIAVLRTEKNLTAGESPEYLHYFIGSVLQKDVTGGSGAVFDDIIERKMR